jgi:hypothetical protein
MHEVANQRQDSGSDESTSSRGDRLKGRRREHRRILSAKWTCHSCVGTRADSVGRTNSRQRSVENPSVAAVSHNSVVDWPSRVHGHSDKSLQSKTSFVMGGCYNGLSSFGPPLALTHRASNRMRSPTIHSYRTLNCLGGYRSCPFSNRNTKLYAR